MTLLPYSTNVMTVKNFPANSIGRELFFGIELETSKFPGEQIIDSVNNSRSWIAKRDSSAAAEYVSIPFKETDTESKLNEIASAISLIESQSLRGVGMHVHINRAYFNSRSETAFINAVNRELMKDNKLIGRKECMWAEANAYKKSDRYQAVNITANTLEVRVFNTTNDPNLIKKRIKWLAKLAKSVKYDPLTEGYQYNPRPWLLPLIGGLLAISGVVNIILATQVTELRNNQKEIIEKIEPICTQADFDNGDCE